MDINSIPKKKKKKHTHTDLWPLLDRASTLDVVNVTNVKYLAYFNTSNTKKPLYHMF